MLDAGELPVLERFVREGTIGSLATLHPVLSPMLWTSIATGMRPFKHGVLGFTEPAENGRGIRPVTSLTRKTKAIWNILNQEGLRSNVVGWWPSHPAESIRGAMVSNHYHRAIGPIDAPWPMAPGTVWPQRLAKPLAELRVHPDELLEEDVLPFLPRVGEIDQEKDPRVATCLKTLAECASVHSAATWMMENEPWDFTAVYYDAIDHFCHAFMKYHPPRLQGVSERDFELYQDVVRAGYRFHDQMLGRLLALAGEETTVILVSDHGFHPDHNRPGGIPMEPAGPAVEHRDFGVFAIRGPGIAGDELIHGASLLDVTPTVLTVFGLPVGEDMDGRPLLECFAEPPDVETVPSWEEIEGDTGVHPEAAQFDPLDSQEAIAQLVALGYIEAPGEDRERDIASTVNELRFNLARSYIDADRHAEAAPILEELIEKEPREYRFGIQLAMCHRALDRIPELRALVEAMSARRRQEAVEARAGLTEIAATLRARKQTAREGPQDAPLLDEGERKEMLRLRALSNLDPYPLEYLLGFVCAAEGRHAEALEHLQNAERCQPNRPGLHIQIGEAYLSLGRCPDAERAFGRAVDIDVANPHAHLGLARSYLPRRKNRMAAEAALDALGLLHHFPLAHFTLGVALHRMGRVERAAEALQVAVSLNPNYRDAHLRLARIYEKRLADPDRAAEHRLLAAQLRRPPGEIEAPRPPAPASTRTAPARAAPIPRRSPGTGGAYVTVVSGLPRSGTSLMMQLLDAGGREVLTDALRSADDDNPRGYFEFEPVKHTRRDPSWLDRATGKAVKMVHLLLPDLPLDRRYKVAMMVRDLDEVMASQRRMLQRGERPIGRLDDEAMKRAYAAQLARVKAYLARRGCFELIEVDYNALLAEPKPELDRMIEFLELERGADALLPVVDPSLYRNRAGAAIR